MFELPGCLDGKAMKVQDDVAVIGDKVFPVNRLSAHSHKLACDGRARHWDNLDR